MNKKIKYVHLLVQKNKNKITYTLYDMFGALKVFEKKEYLKTYLKHFEEMKIVDIQHINYNCNYSNIPMF